MLYLLQITSMYADDEAGGVANSFKNMMEADPDFGNDINTECSSSF